MSDFKKFLLASRYDKPHGILLLFFPCLWGLSLIKSNIADVIFLGIIFFIGACGMRALGCIWNDYNDKNFDIRVKRTKTRLIASNKLKKKQVLLFSTINALIGSVPLFFLPTQSILIALCVLPLIITYPFMKRITWWPQLWLGINFNWGILVGSSAIGPGFISLPIIIFYIGSILFTLGYDTVYGFQDIVDDQKIGIKSTSIKFKRKPKAFLLLVYLASITLWALSLHLLEKPAITICLCFSAFIFLLHRILKCKLNDPYSCYKTFKYNSYYSLLITIILIIIK